MVLVAVLVAVLVTGTLGFFHVGSLYRDGFHQSAMTVAQSELPDLLRHILTSDLDDVSKMAAAENALDDYAGVLHLDENRTCYLLSARDASVILPTTLQAGTSCRHREPLCRHAGRKG